MSNKSFGTMDLANLSLAVTVTALVGLGWGRPGAVAGGVGAILACVNLWVIRRLAARAVARAAAGDKAQASWLIAALGTKMLILFGLVWIAIRVYNLALVPFTIGISVLPISLVFTGLWIGSTAGEQGKA
ncbi:MAG TPA: ATP synthase subunit I [Polyangia bacterium]